MANQRIVSVEGLRGIAAVIVILHHFTLLFYPAYYFGAELTHTSSGIDYFIGQTPIAFFLNGNSAVMIFLVITGFGTMLAASKSTFNSVNFLLTRYFKLLIMCIVACLPALLAIKLNILYSLDVFSITGFPQSEYNPGAFGQLISHKPLESLNAYVGILWPMKYFFYGSILSFIYSFCLNKIGYVLKNNIVLCIVLSSIAFLEEDMHYIAIVLGCFIGGLYLTKGKCFCAFSLFDYVLLFGSVLLCAYPSGIVDNNYFYSYFPTNKVIYYHILGASLLVYCALKNSVFSTILSSFPCQILGKYSMAIYLAQPIVLLSFAPKVFLLLPFDTEYGLSVLVTLTFNFIFTALIAILVQYIMKQCFKVINYSCNWIFKLS